MDYPDYYKILNVKKDASMAEIKEAYHTMVKKYHPDVNNGSKKSEEQLKQVNAAYVVLKSYAKCAEYDFNLQNKVVQPSEATELQSVFRLWPTKIFLLILLGVYILFLYQYHDKDKPYNLLITLNNAVAAIEKMPQKFIDAALVKAVKYDNVKAVAWLLYMEAEAEQYDEHGYNLLMQTDNPQIAELLILHNAKVNFKASDGNSPMQQAVNKQNREMRSVLFKYGSKVPWKK